MATRNGVGGSNEPVKPLDEIQCQVPESFKDVKVFNSVEEAQAYCEHAVKVKKYVFDGHYFKGGKVTAEPDENGKVTIIRCPVGELLVRCVEKAAKLMEIPVFITGEYLCGYSWADSH